MLTAFTPTPPLKLATSDSHELSKSDLKDILSLMSGGRAALWLDLICQALNLGSLDANEAAHVPASPIMVLGIAIYYRQPEQTR